MASIPAAALVNRLRWESTELVGCREKKTLRYHTAGDGINGIFPEGSFSIAMNQDKGYTRLDEQ